MPEGKTLIITSLNTIDGGSQNVYISDSMDETNKVFEIRNYYLDFQNINPIYVSENKVIRIQNCAYTGIVINNSNYTYATDYELIDALNEGMDSLSTMSEMVVLENDSISSQNAILSQENEALMAIDYNFDSLQYVADYLSTQVFDLQQELLVPNIEVDMAIGWNMIGFSCPEEKELTDALNEIVDEVLIMKNNNGSVFMPEFSFNGIGDLTPGHGYQIKVADYILDFNICE